METRQDASRNLLVVSACLFALGLLVIYAASAMKGAQQYDNSFLYLKKQLIAAGFGLALSFFVLKIPFAWFEKLSVPLLIVSAVSLILIFVPGLASRGGGAARWINLVIFRFQPSELAKIAFVFFLAKSLSRPGVNINDWKRSLIPNLLVFTFFSILLLKQPDFGSVVLLGTILVLMMFAAGLRKKLLLLSCVASIVGLILSIQFAPYRMKRLLSFMDPWSQIREGGFQIIQSFLAFQNGGLLGVGLGESKQKLYFLPEAHTDFILAVLGEEMGLIGMVFVCILFSYFCILGFRITFSQPNSFRKHLAFGLTSCIILQALINMGVAMGMLPTKGMPLPFISSGANSLIATFCMTAMLIRLANEKVDPSSK